MNDEQRPNSMEEVIDQTVDRTDGATVTLEEILTSFGPQSYGPLLLLVSLIALFPLVGSIPGMSIVTGTIVILIAVQLLFMRRHAWLPRKILAISFARAKLTKFTDKTRPWAKRIGKFVGPRWTLFTNPPFVNLVALFCIVLAATFFPLALVPFGVTLPAAAVFVFGLALTARDGLLILIGVAVAGASLWLTVYFWPSAWWPL